MLDLGATTVLLTARGAEKLAPLHRFAEEAGAEAVEIPWSSHHEVLRADAVVSALAVEGARAVAAAWEARGEAGIAPPQVLLDVLYDPWPAPVAAVVRDRPGERSPTASRCSPTRPTCRCAPCAPPRRPGRDDARRRPGRARTAPGERRELSTLRTALVPAGKDGVK
ncbi:hypothetical protein [Brachybacterium sp. GPGPB12]|uniref:hypothetical protein n=1 Tax=Brachybacterium sp. GPGPB12 TaxID=3023517 RepID=UPI00313428EF